MSSDELVNDTQGIVENEDGQGSFHRDDLCQIWFTDIPLYCVELTLTEEDIAPEGFIKSWYGSIDTDLDEVVSEDDFLDWAIESENSPFNWLSRYEVKTQVYAEIEDSSQGTFEKAAALYVQVNTAESLLNDTWIALGFTEENKEETFDFAYL